MSTLEDKILGEKAQNYCSSSEGESDNEENRSGDNHSKNCGSESKVRFVPENKIQSQSHWSGSAGNTGPKGVIRDWQRFRQLETEKRDSQEQEKLELMKRLSITTRTDAETEKDKQQELLDDELEELMNDDFLFEFQKKRMAEMLANTGKLPTFGKLTEIENGEDFLKTIDDQPKTVTIIIHIYKYGEPACNKMNDALRQLATEFTHVKFCKFLSTVAGLSMSFSSNGIPALLVYKAGQIIGNFIRVTDDLSDEFNSADVESFLIEVGMLPDKTCVPTVAIV